MAIIVKNTDDTDPYLIADLTPQVEIVPEGQTDLEVSYGRHAVQQSAQLLADIADTNKMVVVNDGSKDLTVAQAMTLIFGIPESLPKDPLTNNVLTVPRKAIGESPTIATHNFCDPTTWWGKSIRVTEEELENPAGDETTWRSDHKNWVDLEHGKQIREGSVLTDTTKYPNGPFTVIVEHSPDNGTTWNMLTMGVDYIIDYRSGEVLTSWQNPFDPTYLLFFGKGAIPSGEKIRATYSYSPSKLSGEHPSCWSMSPTAGKILVVNMVELQFTKDVLITAPIRFLPMMTNPGDPTGPKIAIPGQDKTIYKSAINYMTEGNRGTGLVSPWGGSSPYLGMVDHGVRNETLVFPFDYVSALQIPSSIGGRLDIFIMTDQPYDGEFANAAFYTEEIPDPNWSA